MVISAAFSSIIGPCAPKDAACHAQAVGFQRTTPLWDENRKLQRCTAPAVFQLFVQRSWQQTCRLSLGIPVIKSVPIGSKTGSLKQLHDVSEIRHAKEKQLCC